MLPLLALLFSPAHAEDHYSPGGVAAKSQQFARISEVSMAQMDDLQSKAATFAHGLNKWEVSLGLLGDRAPASEVQVWQAMSKDFAVQKRAVERHLGTLADDTSAAFGDALERALQGVDATVCESAPSGPRLTRGRAEPTECPGNDLNEQIARTIDADPILTKQMEELVARKGPDFTIVTGQAKALGEAPQMALDLGEFAAIHTPTPMKAIQDAEETGYFRIEANLEGELSDAELTQLRKDRDALQADIRSMYASLGAPLLDAMDADQKRWDKSGRPAVGVCPRPAELGGCSIPWISDELQTELASQPKTRKAITKAERTPVATGGR